MQITSVCFLGLSLALLALPAAAAPKSPSPKPAAAGSTAPKELGRFKNWIAATYSENGHAICYAFTRAGSEDPATGTGPVLSVTDRPSGRNQVAISGGPAYPKGAEMTVQVDQAGLDFYTSGHDAFARDNNATTAAFSRGLTAVARAPGAHGAQTTLTFNLDGFTLAHDAIEKACPSH
jgi:hypothetical protein